MTSTDDGDDTEYGAGGPGELMDDYDFALLDGIRTLYAQADPMPADLPERITFALGLRGLDLEMARLVAEDDSRLVTARGPEQSRTITFDSSSLTIMIRIEENQTGTVRIDGWLAPPQRREIEMQSSAATLRVACDEQGRFAFADAPRGTARLVVRAAEPSPGEGGSAVVTPALVL